MGYGKSRVFRTNKSKSHAGYCKSLAVRRRNERDCIHISRSWSAGWISSVSSRDLLSHGKLQGCIRDSTTRSCVGSVADPLDKIARNRAIFLNSSLVFQIALSIMYFDLHIPDHLRRAVHAQAG